MDLLTDVLQKSGLKRRRLDHHFQSKKWKSTFPCEKSFGFHVVLKGPVTIQVAERKSFVVNTGDIVLMTRGVLHTLNAEQGCSVVSGAYQFWNEPIHPFFKDIPTWNLIKADSIPIHDPIQKSLELLSLEQYQEGIGKETVTLALLDMLFTLIIRKVINDKSITKAGWSVAVKDPELSQVINRLHEDPSYPWSLEKIAKDAGISKSSLASKFKRKLGDSPLHYLNTIRIQKAMDLLSNTEMSVEQIADELGFSDPFVFSKSFKKRTKTSPRDYRKNSRFEESQKWKIT